MDLNMIRHLKYTLEESIEKLINEFENKADIEVVSLKLDRRTIKLDKVLSTKGSVKISIGVNI